MSKIKTILENKDNGFEVLRHREGYNLYLGLGLILRIKNNRLEQFHQCLPINSWLPMSLNELTSEIGA
jgi:hypothetical protein